MSRLGLLLLGACSSLVFGDATAAPPAAAENGFSEVSHQIAITVWLEPEPAAQSELETHCAPLAATSSLEETLARVACEHHADHIEVSGDSGDLLVVIVPE